jgi:hypothetical protein
MTAQTEAQASTITTLTEALHPTATLTVESRDVPGAVVLLRARRPVPVEVQERVEPPVVVSDADLTFEQSEAVQVLIVELRPTVAIIAVSPDAPEAVVVRFGRAASGEDQGSTVFVVLDARGELVSVTLGTPGELPEEFVESDETDGALGVNLRAALTRARHA